MRFLYRKVFKCVHSSIYQSYDSEKEAIAACDALVGDAWMEYNKGWRVYRRISTCSEPRTVYEKTIYRWSSVMDISLDSPHMANLVSRLDSSTGFWDASIEQIVNYIPTTPGSAFRSPVLENIPAAYFKLPDQIYSLHPDLLVGSVAPKASLTIWDTGIRNVSDGDVFISTKCSINTLRSVHFVNEDIFLSKLGDYQNAIYGRHVSRPSLPSTATSVEFFFPGGSANVFINDTLVGRKSASEVSVAVPLQSHHRNSPVTWVVEFLVNPSVLKTEDWEFGIMYLVTHSDESKTLMSAHMTPSVFTPAGSQELEDQHMCSGIECYRNETCDDACGLEAIQTLKSLTWDDSLKKEVLIEAISGRRLLGAIQDYILEDVLTNTIQALTASPIEDSFLNNILPVWLSDATLPEVAPYMDTVYVWQSVSLNNQPWHRTVLELAISNKLPLMRDLLIRSAGMDSSELCKSVMDGCLETPSELQRPLIECKNWDSPICDSHLENADIRDSLMAMKRLASRRILPNLSRGDRNEYWESAIVDGNLVDLDEVTLQTCVDTRNEFCRKFLDKNGRGELLRTLDVRDACYDNPISQECADIWDVTKAHIYGDIVIKWCASEGSPGLFSSECSTYWKSLSDQASEGFVGGISPASTASFLLFVLFVLWIMVCILLKGMSMYRTKTNISSHQK